MLFLEGVITQVPGQTKFKRVKAPNHNDMEALVHTISHRVAIVNYRIAVGPNMGKRVFTLQTLPAKDKQHYGQLSSRISATKALSLFTS